MFPGLFSWFLSLSAYFIFCCCDLFVFLVAFKTAFDSLKVLSRCYCYQKCHNNDIFFKGQDLWSLNIKDLKKSYGLVFSILNWRHICGLNCVPSQSVSDDSLDLGSSDKKPNTKSSRKSATKPSVSLWEDDEHSGQGTGRGNNEEKIHHDMTSII